MRRFEGSFSALGASKCGLSLVGCTINTRTDLIFGRDTEQIDDNPKNYSAEIQHPAEDHPILRLTPTGWNLRQGQGRKGPEPTILKEQIGNPAQTECPLWVKSRHMRCTGHVRFTPNSGHSADRLVLTVVRTDTVRH